MPRVTVFLSLALVLPTACGTASDGHPRRPGDPIVLMPDARIEETTRLWAQRWSAATGLDVRVGLDGIPVRGLHEVVNPQTGEVVCGATHRVTRGDRHAYTELIEIDITPAAPVYGCPGWGYILGHEIGHALGARGHCEGGLMSGQLNTGEVYQIDSCAVELVCEQVECAVFNPEE